MCMFCLRACLKLAVEVLQFHCFSSFLASESRHDGHIAPNFKVKIAPYNKFGNPFIWYLSILTKEAMRKTWANMSTKSHVSNEQFLPPNRAMKISFIEQFPTKYTSYSIQYTWYWFLHALRPLSSLVQRLLPSIEWIFFEWCPSNY